MGNHEEPVGRELHPPQGDALTGPGRFAAPQYSGTEYGAAEQTSPNGLPPLDRPYDRSEYGHYEPGERYRPPPRDRARVLPLPDGIRYASWGRRFSAYLLDILASFACVTLPLTAAALVSFGIDLEQSSQVASDALLLAAALAGYAVWLYQFTWRHGSRGQSWGKQATGIHLVNANSLRPPGGVVGLGRVLVRGTLGAASGGVYTLITAVWPLSDIQVQTLDDKMFNTLVVQLPR